MGSGLGWRAEGLWELRPRVDSRGGRAKRRPRGGRGGRRTRSLERRPRVEGHSEIPGNMRLEGRRGAGAREERLGWGRRTREVEGTGP